MSDSSTDAPVCALPVAVEPRRASPTQLMQALAQSARAELARRWVQTQQRERAARARRVVYLSMEFLIGRTLGNALSALGLTDAAHAALRHCTSPLMCSTQPPKRTG